MIESTTYCDLCGDEIEEERWTTALHTEGFYEDNGEEIVKDLCESCKDDVRGALQSFDWKY